MNDETPKAMWIRLMNRVIDLSVTKEWDTAKTEWIPRKIESVRGVDYTCECGKKHIVRLFSITNMHNNNVMKPIGSSCIRRFGTTTMLAAVRLSKRGLYKMQSGEHAGKTLEWLCENYPRYDISPKAVASCEPKEFKKLVKYYKIMELADGDKIDETDSDVSDEITVETEPEPEPVPVPVVVQMPVYTAPKPMPKPVASCDDNRKLQKGKFAGCTFMQMREKKYEWYIKYIRVNGLSHELKALVEYIDDAEPLVVEQPSHGCLL